MKDDQQITLALNASSPFSVAAGVMLAELAEKKKKEEHALADKDREQLNDTHVLHARSLGALEGTGPTAGGTSATTISFEGSPPHGFLTKGAETGANPDSELGLVAPTTTTGDLSLGNAVANVKKYSVQEQREVIRRIQETNQMLKQELSIEMRDAKGLLGHENQIQMEHLQKMMRVFQKKIAHTQHQVQKMEEAVTRRKKELENIRQDALRRQSANAATATAGALTPATPGGPAPTNASSNGVCGTAASSCSTSDGGGAAASLRRVRALENRLELSLVKRNEMESINKHLRAQIEKVRKDRVIFDGIYKKLEKETCDFQARFDASSEELKKAMHAKELVTREILAIQNSGEEEQRMYEQELKEQKAEIDVLMREVRENVSEFSILSNDNGEFAHPSRSAHHGFSPQKGSHGLAVTSLNRLAALSSWKIAYDRAISSSNDTTISKYIQSFEDMKAKTGLRDVQQIAREIERNDDNNFKRFKRVEELNREESTLRSEVEQLSSAIEEFKAQEGIATSAFQKVQYRALETKLQGAQEKNKEYDQEYEETCRKLGRIKACVHSIYSMLLHSNCSKNLDLFSVGGSHLTLSSHSARDVTDANVLEYLQAIETFASSLIKERSDPSENGQMSPSGHGPATLASHGTRKLHVQVPNFTCSALNDMGGSSNSTGGAASSPDKTEIRRKRVVRKSHVLHATSAINAKVNEMAGDGKSKDVAYEAEQADEEERALTYEELRRAAAKAFTNT